MSKLDQLKKELHELERQLLQAGRALKQLTERKEKILAAIAMEKTKIK